MFPACHYPLVIPLHRHLLLFHRVQSRRTHLNKSSCVFQTFCTMQIQLTGICCFMSKSEVMILNWEKGGLPSPSWERAAVSSVVLVRKDGT